MSAANEMICECYRKDPDDPQGQIPASVKLEQLEAIFLLYQFMTWGRTKNAKQIETVRAKIRESLGWTPAQFEACMADVLKMRDGFEAATNRYVGDTTQRLVVPNRASH